MPGPGYTPVPARVGPDNPFTTAHFDAIKSNDEEQHGGDWTLLALNAGYGLPGAAAAFKPSYRWVHRGVELRGAVTLTAAKAANSVIATLPAGFRPALPQGFQSPFFNSLTIVAANGQITHTAAIGSGASLFLDGIVISLDADL